MFGNKTYILILITNISSRLPLYHVSVYMATVVFLGYYSLLFTVSHFGNSTDSAKLAYIGTGLKAIPKKCLFPVQQVVKVMASRVAAIFY